MDDEHVLIINGLYQNIKTVCEFITEGARISGFDDATIFHIELACDEACTNIIEHAYGGENQGQIRARWRATPTHFIVELHDNGRFFDPDAVPTPPKNPANKDKLKIGGLGLHFIKTIMDDVSFTFNPSGNTLTMKKKR